MGDRGTAPDREDGSFRAMLAGGHPNSLGRTVEVVDLVLADQGRLDELFDCYGSVDPVVRLRTSNALKRVAAERPHWLTPLIDRLIDDVGALDQASAQWTLAQLFDRLADRMTSDQHDRAKALLCRNLAIHDDWIVLNQTIDTLTNWAGSDPDLKAWLVPHLTRLSADRRKSVSRKSAHRLTMLVA